MLRLDGCYLPSNSFLFRRGLTHLRLSGSQAMWPALECMLSTLAFVLKLRVLELYGILPSGHSPSSDPSLIDLPSFKELQLCGPGQYFGAAEIAESVSESVQVFVALPNTMTEDGPCSRWSIKLRGRQGFVLEY